MKKILFVTTIIALAVLMESSFASAYGYGWPYTGPTFPRYDGSARIGGDFAAMAPYFTGLRGGIITHPIQDYGLRTSISSYYYPRTYIRGYYGDRYNYDRYGYRVGGYYGRTGYYGSYVYSGRTGLGGGYYGNPY